MPAIINPVAIFAHPTDADPGPVHALARHAVSQQRVPVVLHPAFTPWYADEFGMHAAAGQGASCLLEMVGRHTGGQLWILLRDGEAWSASALTTSRPPWVNPTVVAWGRAAGRMPSRIRHGTAEDWAKVMLEVGGG